VPTNAASKSANASAGCSDKHEQADASPARVTTSTQAIRPITSNRFNISLSTLEPKRQFPG
jgi:hypothetical protein